MNAEPLAAMGMMDRTVFDNVDVDVRSTNELAQLHSALISKAHILDFGRIGLTHHLRFALLGMPKDPTSALRRLTTLIVRLPSAASAEWAAAKTREFDFGFSAGSDETAEWIVPTGIISEVARLNGQIRITIYPAEPAVG